VVAGEGKLPDVEVLKSALKGRLIGRSVSVEVIPERRIGFESR